MKKQLKILIPNATSPQNVGDLVSLIELVQILRKKHARASIIVHSSNAKMHRLPKYVTVRESLSYWILFDNPGFFSRVIKLLKALVAFVSVSLSIPLRYNRQASRLIKDYKEADEIVFSGGGYLRTQSGLRQSLNLVVQLSMLLAILQFPSKKVMVSVSIGPFAQEWQEKLTMAFLKRLDRVVVREKYSLSLLKKHKLENVFLSTDLALLSPMRNAKNTGTPIIGFTIRPWLPKRKQYIFEQHFSRALLRFAKDKKAVVKPIVQVNAPFYGDRDAAIAKRIASVLEKNKVEVLPVTFVEKMKKPTDAYRDLTLLLGMRMHSNIIAATCSVPFVAVSYEYKTEGIASQLGLSDYVIPVEKVTEAKLYKLIDKAFRNKSKLKVTIRTSLTRIRKKEEKRIASVLSLALLPAKLFL